MCINPKVTLFSQETQTYQISRQKNKLKLKTVNVASIKIEIILSHLEHYLYLYNKQHQYKLLTESSKHCKNYQSQNKIKIIWKSIVLHISKVINFILNLSLIFLLQISLHYLKDCSKKQIKQRNIKPANIVVKTLLILSI
ncbi:unnamed protein product [Paramecium octaurelia]|uniref:Transmembrane protein n=1 Tax=Paramecium octaurelia TaxID=43137 RepID=A0A8S1XBA8_PAROT|nr:unnamed protein product [Paramecium octaurelia]